MRKLFLFITVSFILFGIYQLRPVSYPGESFSGSLPPLTQEETLLKQNLFKHVNAIANKIGERHFLIYEHLHMSAAYISAIFKHYGYKVQLHSYRVEVKEYANIIAEVKGVTHPDEVVIVCAHYDTVPMSVGADYDATGIAAILELSRYFRKHPPSYTMRFIAFVNKEVPFTFTRNMGSTRYVKKLLADKEQDKIVGVYALEGLGYYSTKRYSQRYPYFLGAFRKDVGDFLGFVSNYFSQDLLNQSLEIYRLHSKFPSEGFAAPNFITSINSSDHWSFWQEDIPAIMVTDTIFYRNRNYLRETDTVKTIDFDRFARATNGLRLMFEYLHIDKPKQKK